MMGQYRHAPGVISNLQRIPAISCMVIWVQVLIDPVCLMTCFPDLLHNFVYLQPKWSSLFSHAGCMDVLRFFCSRDLLIAEVSFISITTLSISSGASCRPSVMLSKPHQISTCLLQNLSRPIDRPATSLAECLVALRQQRMMSADDLLQRHLSLAEGHIVGTLWRWAMPADRAFVRSGDHEDKPFAARCEICACVCVCEMSVRADLLPEVHLACSDAMAPGAASLQPGGDVRQGQPGPLAHRAAAAGAGPPPGPDPGPPRHGTRRLPAEPCLAAADPGYPPAHAGRHLAARVAASAVSSFRVWPTNFLNHAWHQQILDTLRLMLDRIRQPE